MNAKQRRQANPIPLLLDPASEPAAIIADLDRAIATGTVITYTFVPNRRRRVWTLNPSFTFRCSVDRLPDGLYRLLPVGPITRYAPP